MKKLTQMLFAALAVSLFLAAPVADARVTAKAPAVTATAPADLVMLEAMWTAGDEDYRAALNEAADAYAAKMNARCQGFVDAKAAIAAYNVYTPRGTEAIRDRLVKKQVVTLACMKMHDDGMERTARLRM